LLGDPGTGKTSYLEGLARPGFAVVTLVGAISDPTDIGGLPVYDGAHKCVTFAPPEWLSILEEAREGGVLLLDDLTASPPAVQSAMLRVVLERKVGWRSLPSTVRVVAAANPADRIAGGWAISPPLANRFVHLAWGMSGTVLADAFSQGAFAEASLPEIALRDHQASVSCWALLFAAFLRRDPSLVHTSPAEGEMAFASPRTWEYAMRLAAACDLQGEAPRPGCVRSGSNVFLNLLQGAVGSGAALAFMGFLKSLQLPDPDSILDGETINVSTLRDDELYAVFAALAVRLVSRVGTARQFLDWVSAVLTIAAQVNTEGRVDVIYAPMRQIARGQVLQRAANSAQQARRLEEFESLVSRVFSDTELAQYITVLEGRRDGKSR
jgi:hypothetical protein